MDRADKVQLTLPVA